MTDSRCLSRDTIQQYTLGTLEAEAAPLVEQHLSDCTRCAQTADELEQVPDELVQCLRYPSEHRVYELEDGFRTTMERLACFTDSSDEYEAAGDEASLGGLPARRLREYELLSCIGAGGMGAVFKARHTKLKRTVAIKILTPRNSANAMLLTRFLRETEAVGRLEHPNVVGASDAGEVDGVHFLVMEYVNGIDLAEMGARSGPLPVVDVCEIIRQAASGLSDAHENGLLHRDIKPSNLMLSESGRVKVLDLGLACFSASGCQDGMADQGGEVDCDSERTQRTMGDATVREPDIPSCLDPMRTRAADSEVTRDDQLLGTSHYMAPEQMADIRRADERSDIYSLGCTMYELLTGVAPFAGWGNRRDDRSMDVPDAKTLRADLPLPVDRVLRRMVAVDPDARYSSMHQIADDLGRCALLPLRSPPGGFDPDERTESMLRKLREWRPQRSRRQLVLVGSIVLLLLAGGVVWSLFQPSRPAEQAAPAQPSAADERSRTGLFLTVLKEGSVPTHLTVSHDGNLFACGDLSGTISVFHSQTGQLVGRSSTGNPTPIVALALADDGSWVASAHADHRIHILNTSDGQRLTWNERPVAPIRTLVFAPKTLSLAAAHGDGSIRVYDLLEQKTVFHVEDGHKAAVLSLAFHPSGEELVSLGQKGRLCRWSINSGKLLRYHQSSLPGEAARVAVDQKGNVVFVGDDGVLMHQGSAGSRTVQYEQSASETRALSFSADGTLVTVHSRGAIATWNPKSGRLVSVSHPSEATTDLVALSGKADFAILIQGLGVWRYPVLAARPTKRPRIPVTLKPVRTWRGHLARITAACFSPDGKRVASSSDDHHVIVRPTQGDESLVLKGHNSFVRTVAFRDSNVLLTGSNDRFVYRWDAVKGGVENRIQGKDAVLSIAVVSGSDQAAYCTDQGRIVLFDSSDNGRSTRSWSAHSGPAHAIAFHPTRPLLASAGGRIKLWDSRTGLLSMQFGEAGSGGEYYAVAFSPNGDHLAACGEGRLVRVWDCQSGKLLREWKAHPAAINGLAYSPDGKLLATACRRGLVRVWDTATAELRYERLAHRGVCRTVAFSPNGQFLVSGGHDAVLRLWKLPPRAP